MSIVFSKDNSPLLLSPQAKTHRLLRFWYDVSSSFKVVREGGRSLGELVCPDVTESSELDWYVELIRGWYPMK